MHRRMGTTTVYVTHDQTEAMTLGDRVAVLRKGLMQQVATPRELYDAPVNDFVMTFVGEAIRFDGALVRPHDLELSLEPGEWTREAQVERIVHFGFQVRCELVDEDGVELFAQLTRDQAEELELEPGQIVFVRARESVRRPGVGVGGELPNVGG